MADTTFVPGTTVASAWLNDVNTAVYKSPINVRRAPYNAIGNGIADDYAAIQAAITAAAATGASVYLPAGTYKIGSNLTLPQQHGGIEIYGDAYDSEFNLQTGVFKGSVIVSTTTSGNVISCDGGVFYSNRGIRLRHFSMLVATSGAAIYLKNSPEQNEIDHITVYNSNASGGSGIVLESCWVGSRVVGCHVTSAVVGSGTVGLNIFNADKAGGITVTDSTFRGFRKGVRIGDNVYQCTLNNVAAEIGAYGFYFEGNDPTAVLIGCHAEFNTDIAYYLSKSDGVTLLNCTGFRNAEAASAVKAEIYFDSGGLNFNLHSRVQDCKFFGVGNNVTGIYVSNSAYCSGEFNNNKFTGFGATTTGIYIAGTNNEQLSVENNSFTGITTPYSGVTGLQEFSGLDGLYQLKFAPTARLSTDPNTLDDYEEGTWTPVLGGDGGQTGQTYSEQRGYYQKIGNRVYFTFSVTLTNKGTVSLEAILSGLPFTIGGEIGMGAGSISDFQNLGMSVSAISLIPAVNTTKFYFRRTTAAASSMAYELGSNLYSNTTVIRGSGMYLTNS